MIQKDTKPSANVKWSNQIKQAQNEKLFGFNYLATVPMRLQFAFWEADKQRATERKSVEHQTKDNSLHKATSQIKTYFMVII